VAEAAEAVELVVLDQMEADKDVETILVLQEKPLGPTQAQAEDVADLVVLEFVS
jgi:hypothetical protein